MSCYGWQHGQITLPSAAVAPLKKDLRDRQNALHAEVRTAAVALHRVVVAGTRSPQVYEQAIYRHAYARTSEQIGRRVDPMSASGHAALVAALANSVLLTIARSGAVRQPTVSDVEAIVPRATNRTNSFPILSSSGYDEGRISFEGRVVTWDVIEGNRSVDRARECEVGVRFFAALDRIEWTRGTGGSIRGNDEFNEDERGERRGDYEVTWFGPQRRTRSFVRA